MFHFPTFPPRALCVQARVTGDESSWVSPFGNPRFTVRLPTHRGLSQAPTSFIGSWCQGIHRMPLKTWLQITKMLASTMQFSKHGRTPQHDPRRTTDPQDTRHNKAPDPSGPNNVPQAPTHPTTSFPDAPPQRRRGRTHQRRKRAGHQVNVPPMSTASRTLA